MIDADKYQISNLSNDFEVSLFDCGEYQIDSYLKKYALVNQAHNLGQTWVLHEIGKVFVIGYYTISTTNVQKVVLPNQYTERYPTYPIPCALIGKLGVTKSFKKRGFGKFLLTDALRRIKSLSKTIGINAVIIDAINEEVARYYEELGFERFSSQPPSVSLYLPVSKIP